MSTQEVSLYDVKFSVCVCVMGKSWIIGLFAF